MKGALEVERLSQRKLCEGNLEGGSFNGGHEQCVKGPLWGAGGLSTGGLEQQALETLLGNMESCSFSMAFERRDKFLYLGPCTWATLSIGALLGKLEMFIYWVF